jgi:hypothetical protein
MRQRSGERIRSDEVMDDHAEGGEATNAVQRNVVRLCLMS